jgi:hypothetical protein
VTDNTGARYRSASGALFSTCRNWRYALWRNWEGGNGRVLFIGLNPSKADEHHNDPTIRRCMGFARDWGYGGILMGNIYAFCATRPSELFKTPEKEGPENQQILDTMCHLATKVVCCWGNHGLAKQGDMPLLSGKLPIHCLKLNRSGAPAHPLYLRKYLKPAIWKPVTDG